MAIPSKGARTENKNTLCFYYHMRKTNENSHSSHYKDKYLNIHTIAMLEIQNKT